MKLNEQLLPEWERSILYGTADQNRTMNELDQTTELAVARFDNMYPQDLQLLTILKEYAIIP